MEDIKVFNYYGWDVDYKDNLYRKLLEKNRNITIDDIEFYEKLFKKYTTRRVALEIGAHYGFTVKILSKFFDEVHAFDFDNNIHKFLKRNVKKFGLHNVKIHSYGLGKDSRRVDTDDYIPAKKINGPLSNHIVENPIGNYFIKRIDDLEIDNVDLIIIDTEGYELNVLIGGKETIKKCSPIIIMEVMKKKDLTSRYGYNKVESINFLKKLNYIPIGYVNNADVLLVPKTKL